MLVQDCCCVLSLRAGSLAIGLFQLVAGVLGGAVYFSSYSALDINTKEDGVITYYAVAAGLLIRMLLNMILIYGICKDKTGALLLWIIGTTTILILCVLGVIMIVIIAISVQELSLSLPLPSVISIFTDIALMSYFLVVVHSYRKQLIQNAVGQGKA